VILTLQYSTQWDTLAHVGGLFDGLPVALEIGFGLGHATVEMALEDAGTGIVAVDVHEGKFARAREWGATDCLNPKELPEGTTVQEAIVETLVVKSMRALQATDLDVLVVSGGDRKSVV
jgi:Zn-dependent alcohol dehydrogenase